MAAVTLVLPGAQADRPAHRKATIASVATGIQFDIIDPESDLSDLGTTWATQPRPGRKALTQQGSPKLARYQIRALFVGSDPQASIEPTLLRLKSLASGPNPVALTYGQMSGHVLMTQTGVWVIDNCSISVKARRQGDNSATQAEATIDLLEANIPKWVRPTSMAAAPPANNAAAAAVLDASSASSSAGAVAHVVSTGDTLTSIALEVYGNPNVWRSIAELNNILDPRNLLAGLRLLLP